jgi:hypothetical protein
MDKELSTTKILEGGFSKKSENKTRRRKLQNHHKKDLKMKSKFNNSELGRLETRVDSPPLIKPLSKVEKKETHVLVLKIALPSILP